MHCCTWIWWWVVGPAWWHLVSWGLAGVPGCHCNAPCHQQCVLTHTPKSMEPITGGYNNTLLSLAAMVCHGTPSDNVKLGRSSAKTQYKRVLAQNGHISGGASEKKHKPKSVGSTRRIHQRILAHYYRHFGTPPEHGGL